MLDLKKLTRLERVRFADVIKQLIVDGFELRHCVGSGDFWTRNKEADVVDFKWTAGASGESASDMVVSWTRNSRFLGGAIPFDQFWTQLNEGLDIPERPSPSNRMSLKPLLPNSPGGAD